jgi:hypothetical protein
MSEPQNQPENYESEFNLFNCAAFDHHWRKLAKEDTAATMWLVTSAEAKIEIRQEFVEAFNAAMDQRIERMTAKTGLSEEEQDELSGLLLLKTGNTFPLTVETMPEYLHKTCGSNLQPRVTEWRNLELAMLKARNEGNPTAFFIPRSLVKSEQEPENMSSDQRENEQGKADADHETRVEGAQRQALESIKNRANGIIHGLPAPAGSVWLKEEVQQILELAQFVLHGDPAKKSKRCEAYLGDWKIHGTIDDDDELTVSVQRSDNQAVFDTDTDLATPELFMVRLATRGESAPWL